MSIHHGACQNHHYCPLIDIFGQREIGTTYGVAKNVCEQLEKDRMCVMCKTMHV